MVEVTSTPKVTPTDISLWLAGENSTIRLLAVVALTHGWADSYGYPDIERVLSQGLMAVRHTVGGPELVMAS